MIEQQLEMELDKIKYAISSNAFAYLFLVSNYEDVRNYFIKNISNLNEIGVVDNILISQEEFKKKLENKNGILYVERNPIKDDNSLYYTLVAKREILWSSKKTIITICDEETSISLLSQNQSLATASWFNFLDDVIKDKTNPKELIKKK